MLEGKVSWIADVFARRGESEVKRARERERTEGRPAGLPDGQYWSEPENIRRPVGVVNGMDALK